MKRTEHKLHASYSQCHTWQDELSEPTERQVNNKLFRALPHARGCECDKCMAIRDDNQGAREMMNWRQPPFKSNNE